LSIGNEGGGGGGGGGVGVDRTMLLLCMQKFGRTLMNKMMNVCVLGF